MGNCCGKILHEILVGKSYGKFLWDNLVGNCCRKSFGKLLRENLAGNCCGKILQEILAEQGGGEENQFKKGSDW